jgi:hypothetical protein
VVRGARVGPHLADTVAGLDGGDAEGEEHLALAAADSDGEGLQHVRSVLPCGVRVTAATHPLFAELLEPSAFKRWNGVLLLVVTLRDGSPGRFAPTRLRRTSRAMRAVEPAGCVAT